MGVGVGLGIGLRVGCAAAAAPTKESFRKAPAGSAGLGGEGLGVGYKSNLPQQEAPKRVTVSHGRLIEMACTPLVQKGTLRALFDFGHRTDPHLARSKILQYSASHNLQYNHSEQELEQNPGPGTGDMNREQATRAALKPLLYFFPAFGLLAASGVRQRPPAA